MQTLVIPTPTDTPAVYGPPQGEWTAADWDNLPDDGNRYEIIEGHLYVSKSPSGFHQWTLMNFHDEVGAPARKAGLAYPFFSPMGVFMPGCDPVQPDYFIVLASHADIIRDRRVYGVPDLIVEVLSPGSVDYDEGVKLRVYANAGVPEYVIVNPASRALTHYRLTEPGHYEKVGAFGESDTVTFACLPSISLFIGSLFAGAPDTTL